jgi:hypothetical protein
VYLILKNFFKKVLIFFVALSSVNFFHLRIFVSEDNIKFVVLVAIIFIIFVFILYFTKSNKKSLYTNNLILLLIFTFILSNIMVFILHDQNLLRSFIGSRFLLFYLSFFFLLVFSPSEYLLNKVILFIAFIYSFVYVLQIIIFPKEITFIEVNDFGGFSPAFNLPGYVFVIYVFFLYLERLIYGKKKFIDLFIFFYFLGIIMIMQKRTLILSIILTLFVIIFINRKEVTFNHKLIIIFVIVFIILFLLISGILLKTKYEILNAEGTFGVRIESSKFYIKNYINNLAVIFGNGFENEKENFGREIAYYKRNLGLWPSDIGYLGFIFHFGLISLFVIFFIIYKSLKISIFLKSIFIECYLIFLIIAGMILPLFEQKSSIFLFCLLLYLLESKKRVYNKEKGIYN